MARKKIVHNICDECQKILDGVVYTGIQDYAHIVNSLVFGDSIWNKEDLTCVHNSTRTPVGGAVAK